MSTSHASFADPVDIPRTWRLWWHARPRWLKIAVWAGVGAIVLQGAIAVRIWVGLMDTPEVARIRAAGGSVMYASSYLDFRFLRLSNRFVHPPTLLEGLRGRTNADVQWINLRGIATDELLAYVGEHFPNIRTLVVNGSPTTAQGLASLRDCPLTSLDLEGTNIGDEAIAEITRHTQLVSLDLSGTLITDAAIPELRRLSQLSLLNLSYTDVTDAAIAELRNPSEKGPIAGTILTDSASYEPSRMIWADGRMTGSIRANTRVHWMAKYAGGQTRSSDWTISEYQRALGCGVCEELVAAGDGEYRVTMQVGSCTSKPIDVAVENGKLSVTRLEFLMPVDEATACTPLTR
jgi:hypothetical protein